MSELTADRAGLLACQDVDSVIRVMMKLAGLPRKHFNGARCQSFIDQAKQFQNLDYDLLSKAWKVRIAWSSPMTRPWMVYRLADPEPLKAMLEAVRLAVPTLCLGIDVTWWGKSPRHRVSQRDTIAHAVVQHGVPNDVQFSIVDLSWAPNPKSGEPTEANFDADARLLAGEISRVLEEHRERCAQCIITLDAPLESMPRPKQPPRVKTAGKGQATGAERRQCESAIQSHKSEVNPQHWRAWHADLRIQSGSPVPPRITRLVRELVDEHGFVLWGQDRRLHSRAVIEIFPSEAIWSLGLLGAYAGLTSQEVRAYTAKKLRELSVEAAEQEALRPLAGFVNLLQGPASTVLPARRWCEQIARHACSVAHDAATGTVRKGKGFDDPIESGIAFLTAVAFALGRFHSWGDGADGTIVGPGEWPA